MTPLISVSHVSKRFVVNEDSHRSLKRYLISALSFQLGRGQRREYHALDDVSFDIYPGEFVGIMGRNGAGKSTMLKIISGIYPPTTGSVKVGGTIAPLLELGAGFSLELSGYDNIFLNAAILGYGYQKTMQSLEAIIDFSELRDRIQVPVKKYSSGMLVRLGFAIAVHLDAPILLLDEVLGVGDAGFYRKCLDKIRTLHGQGRTIVLVTHSPDAVEEHCTRCIVIDQQRKLFDGSAAEGAAVYRSAFA